MPTQICQPFNSLLSVPTLQRHGSGPPQAGLPSESALNVDTKHEDLSPEWVKKLNRRQAWTNILVLVDLAISLSILA